MEDRCLPKCAPGGQAWLLVKIYIYIYMYYVHLDTLVCEACGIWESEEMGEGRREYLGTCWGVGVLFIC